VSSSNDPSTTLAARIAWTFAINAIDQNVLQAMATFGNYRTGTDIRPSMEALAERCRISPRTARRAIARLTKAGYLIVKRRRPRQPTTYAICMDKLVASLPCKVVLS